MRKLIAADALFRYDVWVQPLPHPVVRLCRRLLLSLACLTVAGLSAQPETMPWGNVAGYRVEGQRVPFETSIRAVHRDGTGFTQSSKYNWEGRPVYEPSVNGVKAAHALNGLPLEYEVRTVATAPGEAEVHVRVRATASLTTQGVYFCVDWPERPFGAATFSWKHQGKWAAAEDFAASLPAGQGEVEGVVVKAGETEVTWEANRALQVMLKQDAVDQPAALNDPHPVLRFVSSCGATSRQLYFSLLGSQVAAGEEASVTFRLRVKAAAERTPLEIWLDDKLEGAAWDGIGGNFRTQFPDLDPKVIAYCLENLRVSQGRIAMWWPEWHPNGDEDALAAAEQRGVPEVIQRQLGVARQLAQRGIPITLSVWAAPEWAIDRTVTPPKGIKLAAAKLDAVAKSIGDFIVYSKKHYGVEPALFSFNEPDYGVEVRQNAEEHREHALVIGRALVARGLKTRILLGDTGAGTASTAALTTPAVVDPELQPLVGALAFHSYHGVTETDLAAWAELSRRIAVPMYCTEGGPDSAAHRYSQVFLQDWFARLEVDQYVRMLAARRVSGVWPWQLTADYSPLIGAGLYGDQGPLRPTQRFWNLKQLDLTPQGAVAIGCNRPGEMVSAAALQNETTTVVHLVNDGASRLLTVRGLRPGAATAEVWRTDASHGCVRVAEVAVRGGAVTIDLPATSFVTLVVR